MRFIAIRYTVMIVFGELFIARHYIFSIKKIGISMGLGVVKSV